MFSTAGDFRGTGLSRIEYNIRRGEPFSYALDWNGSNNRFLSVDLSTGATALARLQVADGVAGNDVATMNNLGAATGVGTVEDVSGSVSVNPATELVVPDESLVDAGGGVALAKWRLTDHLSYPVLLATGGTDTASFSEFGAGTYAATVNLLGLSTGKEAVIGARFGRYVEWGMSGGAAEDTKIEFDWAFDRTSAAWSNATSGFFSGFALAFAYKCPLVTGTNATVTAEIMDPTTGTFDVATKKTITRVSADVSYTPLGWTAAELGGITTWNPEDNVSVRLTFGGVGGVNAHRISVGYSKTF
jgi:hypothetical protein